MQLIKVYVILLNYKAPNDTIECVDSLKKMNLCGIDLKIVIVDNFSQDDSCTIFNKLYENDRTVNLIFNSENNGYAAGNNIGIKYALNNNAEYIWVLNNDTVVDKNCLKELLLTKKNNVTSMIGAKVCNYYDKEKVLYWNYKLDDYLHNTCSSHDITIKKLAIMI